MRLIKRRFLGVAAATAIALSCASPAMAVSSADPGQSGFGKLAAGGPGRGGSRTLPGSPSQREEVFQLVARSTQVNSIDLAPSGASQGDEIVISGILLRQDVPVGTYGEVCTVTRTGPMDDFDLQCVGTFTLDQGQITVQGRFDPNVQGGVDLAITGGTGEFRTAGGFVHGVNINSTDTRVTVHLVR
ncbi:hypothetical protein AAW14_09595 [Streptomyces hygroscopicus]|uniref:hypothetical protein n=1 Tax=Streptomyces hygroscopicus TaxID=1912 RepID=UPI00223EA429|nr:hypothetical protein [Streptomyces hygroscopicus]MCW7942295.1 hypothetical protein [Streptomyces hygroscopicus]